MSNSFEKDENDLIELIYKPKPYPDEKTRIFGRCFVNTNKDNCKIIYKNNEYDLKEYFDDIEKKYNHKDIISIKLKGLNNITDMSFMFDECKSLISLPDISKWNISKVTSISEMFKECNLLISLPDISNWNTSNVTNVKRIFYLYPIYLNGILLILK